MDLGYFFKSLISSVLKIMSNRVRFYFFGSYFSISLLQIFIGTLIISLACLLIVKILER